VFVLGTYEFLATKYNRALTYETEAILEEMSDIAEVQARCVFAVSDPWQAGKSKSKLSIRAIRAERTRVVDEINADRPDLVVMFGPVAAASVLNKGDLTESDALRREFRPFGDDGPPCYYTFGLENLHQNPGLRKWIELDLMAAVSGNVGTEWGMYSVLRPNDLKWQEIPEELAWMLTEQQ
jgi:uracil-DNA glycosylase